MRFVFLLCTFLLVFAGNLIAQPPTLGIDVAGVSLNKVLADFRDQYGIQLVFDDNLLSRFNITATRQFRSGEEALRFLIKGLPLSIEKSGEVYMIIPVKKTKQAEKPLITVSGQVVEYKSSEPLPFSYILINSRQVQSDQNGHFTYVASADTSYEMRISHLGYFIYDTVFSGGFNRKFYLNPSVTQLGEITIEGSVVEKSTMIGDKPGRMKINNTIAPVMPGYGDNSVFNLLRLMPGILASGEQSSDLIIWGSYESHSKVDFDGFTLFGLKNFNDNIGAVNPLVLKDMEILKGGYEARFGDCVGGMVNITGKNGNLQQPSVTFNLNNITANGLIEIPVSKHSSLLAAYRQTFYELYNPSELNLFPRKNNPNGTDFTLTPDYAFRDANLKYSWESENTSAYISLYGGGDQYLANLESTLNSITIMREETEKNRQLGGAFSISETWKNGNSSRLQAAYSGLWNNTSELNKTINTHNGRERILKQGNGENMVRRITVTEENRLNFRNGYSIDMGAGAESSEVILLQMLFDDKLINMDTRSQRLFTWAQGNLPVNNLLELKAGLRASYLFNLQKFFAEPRLSASMKVTEDIKLNVSWGLYHQYLAKTSLVDSTFNYYYFWANADGNDIPVLKGEHWVAGISYNKNGWTASLEGYNKTTSGLSRFVNGTTFVSRGFYNGECRSYGLDFFLKKEYKNNMAWVSYTLSKTEEHFPFYIRDYYRPAPQDQRHELKFAGVLNFRRFYLSANYVYGSGFDRFLLTDDDGQEYIPAYNRLDAALIYRFKPGKINCETGISILNVLNTENIKLANLRRVATGTEDPLDVNAEAVPFTPTLFLKIKL